MLSRATRNVLQDLARKYPPRLRQAALSEVERQSFHVHLACELAKADGSLVDIGGGTGLFSLGCAAIGLSSTLIDDFADPSNDQNGSQALSLHSANGVRIDRRDVMSQGLGLPANSMDVVTSFDSMEHWHHSPKALFAEIVDILKPGGWFLLGVPNCVNLRKRITVPLGHGKWSAMKDWYETPTFRGHVREPDVDDLRYISVDMGLINVQIFGRNWQGHRSSQGSVRALTRGFDSILQRFPALCSDIYLLGQKAP